LFESLAVGHGIGLCVQGEKQSNSATRLPVEDDWLPETL
jgi:hypothetical protein